ncbi:MAG: hypothetical protein IJF19_01395 [Clostridia bacterium]|nr:hypothetical protein [Clostridia bacterium]
MAKRRCFSVDILESIEYRKLSMDARVLYIELIAQSDDEGVVINPSIALLITGVKESALEELRAENFLLKVEDVYVIRHWHRHNKIQSSKIVKSVYTSELEKLYVNNREEYAFL